MSELARLGGKAPAKKAAAKKAPAKKAAAKKAAAKKAAAKKAAAKKAAAKKAPVKKAAAKKAPAKKTPAKKAAGKKAAGKKAASTSHARRAPGLTSSPGSTSQAPTMALPAPPSDPLAVLGLAQPFSATQLRRAWRQYASRHHPDQGGDAATFSRGRMAYESLAQDLGLGGR